MESALPHQRLHLPRDVDEFGSGEAQFTSSKLRSSLPFGRIALLFASQGALPTRRLAALGAHAGLSTDCYACCLARLRGFSPQCGA